ncbi:Cholinesterase [Dactylellina cionopaga]|nr:Cholinesterase [Dactylellina cionopaga]
MINIFAVLPLLSIVVSATPKPVPPPTVIIKNGTVRGVYSDVWDQDFFLGIPYSQPATGNNRFNLPKPITTKWSGEFVADHFGDRCLGIRHPYPDLPESEDCLNLNIIRPIGYSNTKLPVLVWIHGGAFITSGSSNPPYNMTFMVDQSVKIGKPIIAVSLNYRLTAWGILASTSMSKAGIDNIGLRDQRLALHWVQENIAAFGGDPKKVTIGGDSAGGASVGIHTQAYGGRDDKLFRAAIMDSGPGLFIGPYGNMAVLDVMYNTLVSAVGCTSAVDSLACLRQVPSAQMSAAILAVDAQFPNQWQYHIDGDLIRERSSISLKRGRFVKVPILIGSTSDEGTYFIGNATGVDTTETMVYFVKLAINPNLSDDTINELLKAYPDNPVVGSPGGSIERFPPPFGYEYKRVASLAGDYLLIAGRRLTARAWVERGVTAYSWRFNTIPNGVPREQGSTHVTDQAFVFANFLGVGYEHNYYDVEPASRKENYIKTGLLMSRSIMSFVHDLTPNNHGIKGYPRWPTYDKEDPKNFVFEGNTTSYVEPDTFRKAGINLFIHRAQEFLH